MPTDSNSILCVAAAFTNKDYYKYNEFDPILVANDYVTRGKFKRGYDCPISKTGCFAFICGKPYFNKNCDTKLIKAACEENESYFQQNLAIFKGIKEPKLAFSNGGTVQSYRFLCELTDKTLAIVEIYGLNYTNAIDYLLQSKDQTNTNINHALYLDMGDWSDGWYRDSKFIYDINSNQKLDSIKRNNHQTNWIVVSK